MFSNYYQDSLRCSLAQQDLRKVLGGSVLQIIGLVSREFVRLLLTAFTIGSILVYLFTSKFVFQIIYKYHPDAGPEPYMETLLIILFCCGLIIGTKVFQAATSNPIQKLHND